MTDFMITNLQAAARKVINKSEIIHLSQKDQQTFLGSLSKEYEPNSAMKQAIQDHQEIFSKK